MATPDAITHATVYAMVDHLVDIGRALNWAGPARLQDLHAVLRWK